MILPISRATKHQNEASCEDAGLYVACRLKDKVTKNLCAACRDYAPLSDQAPCGDRPSHRTKRYAGCQFIKASCEDAGLYVARRLKDKVTVAASCGDLTNYQDKALLMIKVVAFIGRGSIVHQG
jgi:hypothetical protein